jgi:Holliday junction resolvase
MYERELKQLLQGDRESLEKYSNALAGEHQSAVRQMTERPFLVVRAAGSLGFDLVALRSEFSFPIEVKSSHSKTIHFSAASGRAAEQLRMHREAVDRVGLLVLYAYRRIGLRSEDPWRIFTPQAPAGRGRLELIRRRIPAIDATREGNAVLRWEDGMPLSSFFSLVSSLVDRPGV